MKFNFFILILFFCFCILSTESQAQEVFRQGRSVRATGMGGVIIPFAKGTEAIFYNPANLAKNGSLDFNFANVGLGLNGLDAINLIQASSSITNPASYNQFFGKQLWFEGEGHLGITVPNFGVGYLTEYHASLQLHNPGTPKFQTYFLNDAVTGIGFGGHLGPKTTMGMTLKKIDRWGGDTVDIGLTVISGSSSLSTIGDNFANKGNGYGIDLGFTQEFDLPTSPSISFTWKDIGNTAFVMSGGTAAPPHIDQNMSVGLGGGFDLPGLDWAYGLEMNNLNDSSIQPGKKIHLGTELSLPIIDLRAGLSQGYMTYGLGINLFILELDLASYTEELGSYPGQTAQNRWLLSLNLDISFDANFSFSADNNSGKRRKLKKRR